MQPRKAFTLLEVLLVMVIIVVMAALSYPSLMSMYADNQVRTASDNVRAGWIRARSQAVDEGQRYRFAVVSGKGNYRIAPDSPESGVVHHQRRLIANPPYIFEDVLPAGIVFDFGGSGQGGGGGGGDSGDSLAVGSVDPGQWTPAAYFETDGTAQDDVSITFKKGDARPLVLNLRALTGISTVSYAPLEGQD